MYLGFPVEAAILAHSDVGLRLPATDTGRSACLSDLQSQVAYMHTQCVVCLTCWRPGQESGSTHLLTHSEQLDL